MFSFQVKLQLYDSREILADNSSDRMHRHSHIGNIQQSISAVSLQLPSILRCVIWDRAGNSVVHNRAHGPDAAFSYSSLVVNKSESNAIIAIPIRLILIFAFPQANIGILVAARHDADP